MARVTGCREAVPVVKLSATEVGVNWWLNKNLSERNAYMLENEIEMDITFIFRQTENHKEKGERDLPSDKHRIIKQIWGLEVDALNVITWINNNVYKKVTCILVNKNG